MSYIKVVNIEPCQVASFHIGDSLTPEDEAHASFINWAKKKGILPEQRWLHWLSG